MSFLLSANGTDIELMIEIKMKGLLTRKLGSLS